jgi:uncharacterized protein (TIGR02466 family)
MCNAQVQQAIEAITCFPTMLYIINKKEFVNDVLNASNDSIQKECKPIDEIFPCVMSGDLLDDPRIEQFANFVGQTSFDILHGHGYDLDGLATTFTSMWCQEHHKHSLMEQHVHGEGTQLVGFYFLEVPENSSPAIFYDPRPGKVMGGLKERSNKEVNHSSNAMVFKPEVGMLIFAPAWLPHAFGRHASSEPLKFIHFNIGVIPNSVCNVSHAEVI